MMRSMSVAIAALRNHQVYMDVVSSNISNVNTTGFKASRIGFQELLSQTLRGSSAPRGGIGGLNPIQIGLGMALGGIDTLFTQGSLQDTGKLTDLAVQGDGFFVLDNGEGGYAYSRDGNLDVGIDGSMLNLATGMKVLGWQADEDGVVDTSQAMAPITIPFGQSMAVPPARWC
jgi:flagellar hook protein FlgE